MGKFNFDDLEKTDVTDTREDITSTVVGVAINNRVTKKERFSLAMVLKGEQLDRVCKSVQNVMALKEPKNPTSTEREIKNAWCARVANLRIEPMRDL